MNRLIQYIYDDLLTAQEVAGSEFLYEEHGNSLVAIVLDTDGNEIDRYHVEVSLEKAVK